MYFKINFDILSKTSIRNKINILLRVYCNIM